MQIRRSNASLVPARNVQKHLLAAVGTDLLYAYMQAFVGQSGRKW